MKQNIALISVLAVLIIAFSGCVGNNTPAENVSGMSKVKNLPAGFEFIGNPSLSIDQIKINYKAENVSGILGGSEGLYKDSNNSEFYIDVIQLENEEAANNFISTYKSSFTPLKEGSRFAEESFNGHSAVKITNYVTEAGKTVPRYIYTWNHKNYVLVVSGTTVDNSPVRQLAEATGY